ncbi:MAG: iron ABC transporter permease [Crocinitomicaceae bacterium]|nr:iron ABC transporter permease [Crocinitomicaceae bacterium]
MNKLIYIYSFLALAMVFSILLAISFGASEYSVSDLYFSFSKLFKGEELTMEEKILLFIRVPRVFFAVLVGGILAMGGTLLQALFRNPIVEPGMIGTTNGAAAGAALFFVLGQFWLNTFGEFALPIMAFLGGLGTTFLVLALSTTEKFQKTNVLYLLLIGIAINAVCLSLIGLMSYWARDPQARSITFWSLGTLSGATWQNLTWVAIVGISGLFGSLMLSKKLDTLMLGEQEAHYLGVRVQKLRIQVILINVFTVSFVTAFTGVIGFVGLIVPHLLRILYKSDHRYLLIGSFLLGGTLICLSDLACRYFIAPAEIPLSVITSLIGVPIFIFLLRKNNYRF